MFKFNVAAAALFFLSSTIAHADIVYVWRDADGITHYADTCPPNVRCKTRTFQSKDSGWAKNARSSSTTTSSSSTASGDGTSTTTSGGTTTSSSGNETLSSQTSTTTSDTTTISTDGTTTTTGGSTTTTSSGTTISDSTSGDSTGTQTALGQGALYWDPVAVAAGYRLYFGTSASTYPQVYGDGLNVGNVTSYTISGLESGKRYYFSATTYDSNGNESILSNQAFKDIP